MCTLLPPVLVTQLYTVTAVLHMAAAVWFFKAVSLLTAGTPKADLTQTAC
jgi:hypothetical protein